MLMNITRRNILICVLTAILFISLCVGVTYAFLTDSATSSQNKVQSGRMKVDLQMLNEGTDEWTSVNGEDAPMFNYGAGALAQTDVKILQVKNDGELALKWQARIVCDEALSDLAQVINVYVKTSNTSFAYPTDKENLDAEWKLVGTLDEFIHNIPAFVYGDFLPAESDYFGIALRIQSGAGDEYQDVTLGAFNIEIRTLQMSHEADFFDNLYDAGLEFPCGHGTIQIISGYPATCTETGLTNGKKCATCHEIFLECKTIPMIDHTAGEPQIENEVPPTVTTNGSYDSVVYCTSCGTKLSSETVTTTLEDLIITKDNRTWVGYRDDVSNLSLNIPDIFKHSDGKWYKVTAIGSEAFENCTNLVSVKLPDTVTTIGAKAFMSCSRLENVTIPTSVTSISNGVFAGCTDLESVTIPNSVTSIGDQAFKNCSSLTSITLPNALTTIGEYAFQFTGLTSITIPDGVTTISNGAFAYCSRLENISLPLHPQ